MSEVTWVTDLELFASTSRDASSNRMHLVARRDSRRQLLYRFFDAGSATLTSFHAGRTLDQPRRSKDSSRKQLTRYSHLLLVASTRNGDRNHCLENLSCAAGAALTDSGLQQFRSRAE
jgi:hypothetical protein